MSRSRRMYVKVGRIISPFALLGLRIYSAITKRPRVRVVVTNECEEILLVQGTISHLGWWMLPGGGVDRGEATRAAAKRELFEETGIDKPLEDFQYLRTVRKAEYGYNFDAPLFHITVSKTDLPSGLVNPREIAAVGWFKLDALPGESASIVSIATAEYKKSESKL